MPTPSVSPFAASYANYTDAGISVIPIIPPYVQGKRPLKDNKFPAVIYNGYWGGMEGWQRFSTEKPSNAMLENWATFKDANIGAVLGPASSLICIDYDYSASYPELQKQLEKIFPGSPVKKQGAKGYTAFYQWSPELTEDMYIFSFERVTYFEIFCQRKQTLLPNSIHPETLQPYIWLTPDTLLDYPVKALPFITMEQIRAAERVFNKFLTSIGKLKADGKIHPIIKKRVKREADTIWDVVNEAAFADLSWCPPILGEVSAFDLQEHSKGHRYSGTAFWRGGDSNDSVSIFHSGIADFPAGKGYSPIGLVQQVLELSSRSEAFNLLRNHLFPGEKDQEAILARAMIMNSPKIKGAVSDSKPRTFLREKTIFETAPEFPQHLINAPGLVGELTRYTYQTAPHPIPELALGSAIATMGLLYGNLIATPSNLRTNFLIFGVSASGTGKDHPLKMPSTILSGLDLLKYKIGELQSGNGLFRALGKQDRDGKGLWVQDEVGYYFHDVFGGSKASGSPWKRQVITDAMTLYTSAGDKSVAGKEYADKETARVDIKNPHLCAFGVSTPEVFFSAFKAAQATDGCFARMTILHSAKERTKLELSLARPRASIERKADLPSLLEAIKANINLLTRKASGGSAILAANGGYEPVTVYATDECIALEEELTIKAQEIEAEYLKYDAERLASIWRRFPARVEKLALVASDGNDITPEVYQWAFDMALFQVKFISWIVMTKVFDSKLEEAMDKLTTKILTLYQATGRPVAHHELMKATRSMDDDLRPKALAFLIRTGMIDKLASEEMGPGGYKITYYTPRES